MKVLVQHLFEEKAPTPEGFWEDVVGNAKPIEVAIERLLAFNALTIVGSDGESGNPCSFTGWLKRQPTGHYLLVR